MAKAKQALPRHVLCALGNWKSLEIVERVVVPFADDGFSFDREYSQLAPDDRMMEAFEAAADCVSPSITDNDRRSIAEHTAVAYVLSPPMPAEKACAISTRTLELACALLKADGVAVKSESAGIAHGYSRWLELAESSRSRDHFESLIALYHTWVRQPISDESEGVYYSVGMHLLGRPDVEIPTGVEIVEAIDWIEALGIYLISEMPARGLKNGDGFRRHEGGPRRLLIDRECTRYARDDFFFNPYGYLRLT